MSTEIRNGEVVIAPGMARVPDAMKMFSTDREACKTFADALVQAIADLEYGPGWESDSKVKLEGVVIVSDRSNRFGWFDVQCKKKHHSFAQAFYAGWEAGRSSR